MKIRLSLIGIAAAAVSASAQGGLKPIPNPTASDSANVVRLERSLADDSMQGRGTATPGGERAARFLAAEMRRIGLQPAGDDGYFQTVPMYLPAPDTTPPAPGRRPMRRGLRVAADPAALDSIPMERRRHAVNVIGILPGGDPQLRNEVVLVLSHYDHLGIGRPDATGDSIYNGADDDASGTVAVLEIARLLHAAGTPRRTIVFANMTGEEMGLLGTNYFIAHPVVPLDRIVAGFEIEMIGRPDSLAGGEGKAWLTGYERSTMGDMLKEFGIPIVPDPRPDQNFFRRSDNYGFALRGIVAHTLSTFNLHTDYHRPSDDVSRVDFAHMTAVVHAAAQAVAHLADGPRPQWHPGGQPQPRGGGN